ncbi:MAG: fructose-bisphosphatase class II family protein [Rhodospirillales bacterium]|nr:fructose-bisphosphatase class II family protein [Rhodospirillales bacterium]
MTPEDICKGQFFIYALRSATEAAARAAFNWIGRGERGQGDQSARQAMFAELAKLPISGKLIFGEGEGDMKTGSVIGIDSGGPVFDIAVDPVEGTSYMARGMTNAMAVMALAPEGTMFDPGPAFYMEKFVAPPGARGKIDPEQPIEGKLKVLGKVLNKPVSDLTVYVLEKPRHRELVERIHNAGARVALYPAGDVAGALMAAIPNSGIDALAGTGGTREGIISACAIRALGGEVFFRIDPQLATEKAEVSKAGLSTTKWMAMDDIISSDEVYFCATGITTGLLVEGVERTDTFESTQTMMIAGPNGIRQLLTTFHPRTF